MRGWHWFVLPWWALESLWVLFAVWLYVSSPRLRTAVWTGVAIVLLVLAALWGGSVALVEHFWGEAVSGHD